MIEASVVFDSGVIKCNGFVICRDYDIWVISKNGINIDWGDWIDAMDGWSLEQAIKYCLGN